MNTYIAFFDVLGFKEFIYKNDLNEAKRQFAHLLRDSQTAAAKENYIDGPAGVIFPDLDMQNVNCLHVSDSIVFWTETDDTADFLELVDVCYALYWRSLQTSFPLRGCLTYGEIDFSPFTINGKNQKNFHNYSIIGKGLVDAYSIADSLEYAGCILDRKAIERVNNENTICDLIYDDKICFYKVPFKTGDRYEHVFRPYKKSLNNVAFRNASIGIERLFTYHTKQELVTLPDSVRKKMNNTIDFLNYFRSPVDILSNVDESKKT